jgi:hypothetical protein
LYFITSCATGLNFNPGIIVSGEERMWHMGTCIKRHLVSVMLLILKKCIPLDGSSFIKELTEKDRCFKEKLSGNCIKE